MQQFMEKVVLVTGGGAGIGRASRRGVPEDVAPMVVMLASAQSAWVTGQIVTVDGGLDAT